MTDQHSAFEASSIVRLKTGTRYQALTCTVGHAKGCVIRVMYTSVRRPQSIKRRAADNAKLGTYSCKYSQAYVAW
jgi:hypothetical protein